MFNIVSSLFSSQNRKLANAYKALDKVNALEEQVGKMSYQQMQERIKHMRAELSELVEKVPSEQKHSLRRSDPDGAGVPANEAAIRNKLLDFLPEVFAFIRETYSREFGIRHYDVQIMAGAYLAEGWKLAEIKTGEGKTMIFNLPLFLYSLVGRGAHLVTVNDYLAKRDGEYAGHIASKLGLSVAIVASGGSTFKYISTGEVEQIKGKEVADQIREIGKPKLSSMQGLNLVNVDKKEGYACDIVFSVNNELGFDYLRDNMAWDIDGLVQRELYFCIVDEADSILIDEARTPLIISSIPSDSDTEKYKLFAKAVQNLQDKEDYEVDYKTRSAVLTDKGIDKVQSFLGVENVWADYSMVHHLENALQAKTLYIKDDKYIIKNDEVLIVDEFTGRVMPGRRFSEGIHQAIEAKEGVTIRQESKTYATITFQNFFRLYKWVSGASGTVMTESEEFYKIYSLDAVAIPTHRQVVRDDRPDLIFKNYEAKFKAVAQDIKERNALGQPVLVGTTSVEKSEKLSAYLDELGIAHNVLNAKYHEQEAQIVAKAGQPGAVTVATNMAGRGTDIPLGEGVKELGGLAVIGTERHDARRIDNQLRGRSGRQGDPGYSRFYVSLDDNIMRIMGGEFLEKTIGRLMFDDAPIENKMITKQIETAQTRVEWSNFDTRKRLVEYDDVLNQQREIFYSRRRKLIELADKAIGKLLNQGEEQDTYLQEIEVAVKDMFSAEVGYIVQSQFAGDKQLSEESLQKLVAQVLDFGPDFLIGKSFDLGGLGAESKLKDKLRGLTESETLDYLQQGVERMVDAKIKEFGSQDFPVITKMLILESMSRQWMEHLETMADIRSGIGLVGYAQRNPLVEYKNVGFRIFQELLHTVDADVVRRFLKVSKVAAPKVQQQLLTNEDQISDVLTGDREMMSGDSRLDDVVGSIQQKARKEQLNAKQAGSENKGLTIVNDAKVGRNDPCPCGSGKKYKQCGLVNSAEHQKNLAK